MAAPSSPGHPVLGGAIEEIATVARILSPVPCVGAQAARLQDVYDLLPQASIVHIACSIDQDDLDPLNSGFCFSDGRLTIAALMRLKVEKGLIAFLSACDAAKEAGEQSEQGIHPAAAMLFVGFPSVVATMWCVEIAQLRDSSKLTLGATVGPCTTRMDPSSPICSTESL